MNAPISIPSVPPSNYVRRRLERLHELEQELAQVASAPKTIPAPACEMALAACRFVRRLEHGGVIGGGL